MSRQLIMPILKDNGSLFKKIMKLHEEQMELYEAYFLHQSHNTATSAEHLASEAYDCLQVALGVLLEIEKDIQVDLVRENDKHVTKLFNRQLWVMRDELIKIQIPD